VRTSSEERRPVPGRRTTILRWSGGLVAAVGLASSGFAVGLTVPDQPPLVAELSSTRDSGIEPDATRPGPASVTAAPERESTGVAPRRLRIPDLGIEARVLPIAVQDGALVPPADPQQLGWWRDGAGIGADRGSVLITGHTVHSGGGSMDRLAELEAGAEVTVETSAGETAYTVVSVTYFPKQALADKAAELFDQAGPHRLVLITCDSWNGTTYDGNAVAIARPLRVDGTGA